MRVYGQGVEHKRCSLSVDDTTHMHIHNAHIHTCTHTHMYTYTHMLTYMHFQSSGRQGGYNASIGG